MNGEYYEIIKISDFKEREIESYYIDPDLTEFEKLIYIIKKGALNQKIAFINNLHFFLSDSGSIKTFFNVLKEKMFDFEQEVQLHIVLTLTKYYTYPYRNEIKLITDEHIHILLVLIVRIVTDDEKSKKNEFYIELFKRLVDYYRPSKMEINKDFITFVVNLASFGQSNLSRQYSVIFATGFSAIINSHNSEIIERFFRSATDTEKCVRLSIAQGFYDLCSYIIKDQSSVIKLLKIIEQYCSALEDIQIRILTIKELIKLSSLLTKAASSNEDSDLVSTPFVHDYYEKLLKFSLGSVLNDSDIVSKTFITNDELIDLKLWLIKEVLFTYELLSKYEVGVEIKKFFYVNFFFRNKIQINQLLLNFVIENFNLLLKLSDSPYSPSKQKKLYQNHFKEMNNRDNFSIPDLEIPQIKKISLEAIKPVVSSNSSVTGFSFSSDWPSELFKVLLECVFAKKVDEEDCKSYNNIYLKHFFGNLQGLLNEKNYGLLINKLENKFDDLEIFETLILSLDPLTKVIKNNGLDPEPLLRLLNENKAFIEASFFPQEEKKDEKMEKYFLASKPNNFVEYPLSNNLQILLNNRATSALGSFKRSILISQKFNPKDLYQLNWRAIKSYIGTSINLVSLNLTSNIDMFSIIIQDLFSKINSNFNFQLQKSFCEAIVDLYEYPSEKIRTEIINQIVNVISKNKNFYIRRFFIVTSDFFLVKYTFHLYKDCKLYSFLIKKLRDPFLISNVLDLLWKIYPFIHSNIDLKKELDIQLEFVKASYVISAQSRSQRIVAMINSFMEKLETIYSYDLKGITTKEAAKYNQQLCLFQKNENIFSQYQYSEFGNGMVMTNNTTQSRKSSKLNPHISGISNYAVRDPEKKMSSSRKVYKFSSSVTSTMIDTANQTLSSHSLSKGSKPSNSSSTLIMKLGSKSKITSQSFKSSSSLINPLKKKLSNNSLRKSS